MLPPTYADHSNPERTLGRSEIARRRVYMDKLNHQFSEICPRLIDLVSRCLQIVSDLRPSSEKLLTMLLSIKNEMEDLPGDGITKVLEMANIVSIRETKILEKKIVNLQVGILLPYEIFLDINLNVKNYAIFLAKYS